MGRCVFCGWEGTLTKEHAWPDWIRDVLPAGHVKGHSQQHRVAATTGEVTAITPVLHEKAANRKVQVVCQRECNGGWMSDLENTAKPLLVPIILGEAPHPLRAGSDDHLIVGGQDGDDAPAHASHGDPRDTRRPLPVCV